MQHVTMENPGETKELHFRKEPFENEPLLPDDFAIVPTLSLNHADVSVPKVQITKQRDTETRTYYRKTGGRKNMHANF